MSNGKMIVGTAVPLWSLWSSRPELKDDEGTTAVGELFVDWLAETGQRAWQLLPLSETHLEPGSRSRHVPSPYKGYGIGLDPRYLPTSMKDVEPNPTEMAAFRQDNRDWLPDYVLFCAIRDEQGTDDWSRWPKRLRERDPAALREAALRLKPNVERYEKVQWRLHEAFGRLRERADLSGVRLLGDLPFYLPFCSPLVWAHRECFQILKSGKMSWVSGVPDGPQSHYGRQVWGHPLYAWSGRGNVRKIVDLWKMRIGYYARFYDAMRLDHAKGFFNYGAMRVGNSKRDRVRFGPGRRVLSDLISFCRQHRLELFAEDSGDRLKELRQTLNEHDVAGIRILRWGYNEKRQKLEREYAEVDRYPKNCYAFTHTHDTVTLAAYVKSLSTKELRHLCEHVGVQYTRARGLMVDRLIGAVLSSPAHRAVVPIQDWLHAETRINVPGTERARKDPNWRYRCEKPVEKLPKLKL